MTHVDLNLPYYSTHPTEPLPFDAVDLLGLDGTGRDGNERFPYTWGNLTEAERAKLLGVEHYNSKHYSLPKIAAELADVLNRLSLAWDYAAEQIDDQLEQDALNVALSEGYPLGRDLAEAAAEAGEWVEHVEQVMSRPPAVLELVAKEITGDVQQVTADLAKEEAPTDEAYRKWQNGGLGGEVGRFGGVFTPGIAERVAALLLAVNSGDTTQINKSAERLARQYRVASRASRT